jgi:hypothetical protein
MKETLATFELVEIDRRQFLRLAGGTLVSLSALGLVGCGGSGGGSSHAASGLTTTSGSIQFPAGFSGKLTGLTVSNGFGTSKVASSMSFGLATGPTNPSLAYVQDSTGAVIFVGFVDPTTRSNILGPTSTAVALLYFALDAYMMPGANNAAVLALIAADPNVAALAGVIGKRVLANSYAFNVSDPQICSALATAVSSIKGAGSSSRPQVIKSLTARPKSDPAQLSIQGGTQSGFNVNVDSTGATTSFTGQNTYRRYARIYVYQTSATDEAGVVTTFTNAQQIGTPLDVLSTERLNIGTALKDIFTTTSPLSPVTTDPITLSTPTGAVAATFDIIVLGSSGITVAPAFFDENIYGGFVSMWKADLSTLNLRTAIGDVFFGLILNMVGVASIDALPVNIDAAVASLEAIGESAWQASLKEAAASATNLMSPVRYAANILLKGSVPPLSSSQWARDVWEAFEVLLKGANAASAAAISEASFSTYLAVGFRVIIGAITGASLVLGTGDLAAVLKDMMNSNQGDLWSATLAIPPIHLTPTSANIVLGSSTPPAFTVSPPTGATGPFKWTWTLTGGVSAKLTDEEGNEGTILTDINASTVYLLTTSLDVNPMSLKVEGFFVGTSLTPIGAATASITSDSYDMSLTPSATVSVGNQQLYTAVFNGKTPPPTGLTWQWTSSGGGSLAGGNNVVTTIPSVIYTAPSTAGNATLSVKLLNSSKNVIAQASIAIPISTTPSGNTLTITNNFPAMTGEGYNGTYQMTEGPYSFLEYYQNYNECEMMYVNPSYATGGQQFRFGQYGVGTQLGIAGTIDDAAHAGDGLVYFTVYEPGSTFNNSFNPTPLPLGSCIAVISNVKDDGTHFSFSYSFNFSNSSGTSVGTGTYIIQNNSIGHI